MSRVQCHYTCTGKAIPCLVYSVTIHVLVKQYYVSRTILNFSTGSFKFTKTNEQKIRENMAKLMEYYMDIYLLLVYNFMCQFLVCVY